MQCLYDVFTHIRVRLSTVFKKIFIFFVIPAYKAPKATDNFDLTCWKSAILCHSSCMNPQPETGLVISGAATGLAMGKRIAVPAPLFNQGMSQTPVSVSVSRRSKRLEYLTAANLRSKREKAARH
jgi:hypothetical protein